MEAELWAPQNALAQRIEADPAFWVEVKYPLQDPVQSGRDGKDGLQEIGIPQERTEGRVVG